MCINQNGLFFKYFNLHSLVLQCMCVGIAIGATNFNGHIIMIGQRVQNLELITTAIIEVDQSELGLAFGADKLSIYNVGCPTCISAHQRGMGEDCTYAS